MHNRWDRKMKRLFRVAAQDFVEWIIAGAKFISIVSSELEGEPLYTDILYEILLEGKPQLLHIEFQRRRDSKMAERLWEYNMRATLQYKCPVWSVVIYLKEDSTLAEPVLTHKLPNGRVVHRFEFEIIRLWEIPTQELKRKGLVGLLPLLPLTREGARREVVEEIITVLTLPGEEPKGELLTLTYGLASLAFENESEADQEWLIRRFAMLYDILRETRAYQEMTKESRQEGREEGLEEGLEKGRLQTLRQTLLHVVQARFPRLVRLAKGRAAMIDDPDVLDALIVKVSIAQTVEEAKKHLLIVDEDEEEEKDE